MAKRQLDKESHYKSIINKQKQIIKELKKQVRGGSKTKKRYEDLEQELIVQLENEVETNYTEPLDNCSNCHKGRVEFVDLGVRKMLICARCNYRKIKKQ
jgi:hypothetical protein